MISKEKKAQIKSELESFLSSYSGDTSENDIVDDRFNEFEQNPPIDFEEMSLGFKKKALEIEAMKLMENLEPVEKPVENPVEDVKVPEVVIEKTIIKEPDETNV